MEKLKDFYQTITELEILILHFIESKDILHSTSKKELTINSNNLHCFEILILSFLSIRSGLSQSLQNLLIVRSIYRSKDFLSRFSCWFSTEIRQVTRSLSMLWDRNVENQIFPWVDSKKIWWAWPNYWGIESWKESYYRTRYGAE